MATVLLVVGCTSPDPVPEPAPPPPPTLPGWGDGDQGGTPRATDEDASWLAPDGSDDGSGRADQPWRTWTHALAQLRPGQTLFVRGGTYRERVRDTAITAGRPDAPIVVRAAPGERPVVQGLLYLRRPSYWTIDGINVTWDSERNESDQHMVKVTDGVGWTWQNSELWGARSLANILVVGERRGEPSQWSLRGNCIHDTLPANGDNEDSNVYLGDMEQAGPGVVERNLIFGADNGRNIKIGPGNSKPTDGPTGVTVRYNTLYRAAVPIVVSGGARDILIERNILGGSSTGFLIRGYKLAGPDVVAEDNVGFGARAFVAPDSGTLDARRGNRLFDQQLVAPPTACGAGQPVSADAELFGHLAVES